MPESSERKPSPGDPFTTEPKTEWAEFQSAAPPFNKSQKATDFSKSKQLWYYLGKTSTESKAQYTANLSDHTHDPESSFLQSVEVPRQHMAPPSQPKRQSLAASYPGMATPVNMAARNAAMANIRQHMLERQYQGTQDLPYTPINIAARAATNPHHMASADQRQILERQHQKAQRLDMQETPYETGLQVSRPTSGIGIDIDIQAVERQRQFQQHAAQQSQAINGWPSRTTLPPLHHFYDPPSLHGVNMAHHPSATANLDYADSAAQGGGPTPVRTVYHPQSLVPAASSFTGTNRPSNIVNDQSDYTYGPHDQRLYQNVGQAVPPISRIDPVGAYEDRLRIQNERARIDEVRAAANQSVINDSFQPAHRKSGSAYPFKSPEELKAQKERGTALQQSPTQLYQGHVHHPSSPLQQDQQHQPYRQNSPRQSEATIQRVSDAQQQHHPQRYINPSLTQIKPLLPSSTFPHATMGPPPAPNRRSSASASHVDVPMGRERDPYLPNDVAEFDQRSIIQDPSDRLSSAIKPRPAMPDGTPVNDKPVAEIYQQWKAGGGFWGTVAEHFIRSHLRSPSVYRSPYSADGSYTAFGRELSAGNKAEKDLTVERGSSEGLAAGFYNGVTDEEKGKIDAARAEN